MPDKKNEKTTKKASIAKKSEKAKKAEKKERKGEKLFDLSQNRILRLITLVISAIGAVWGIVAFFLHIADNEVAFMNFAIYFVLFFVIASVALGVNKKIVAIINIVALAAVIAIAFMTPIFYIYSSVTPVECDQPPCSSVTYDRYNYFGINWES